MTGTGGTGRRNIRPERTPRKRKPAKSSGKPVKAARKTKTQTLMKISVGEGWRNRVTVQLPAWLLMGCALLVLVCVLTLLFSPDFAAKAGVAIYEFIQHFTRSRQ